MEEADVLCSRIAIVTNGKLRSIGTQQHLKSKFGKGFKITVSYDVSNQQQVQQFITDQIPSAVLVGDYFGSRIYQIPKDAKLSHIFKEMEMQKVRIGIKNWSLSQASLEEVFLDVVG